MTATVSPASLQLLQTIVAADRNSNNDEASRWLRVFPKPYGVVEVLGLRVKERTLGALVDAGYVEGFGVLKRYVRATADGCAAVEQ